MKLMEMMAPDADFVVNLSKKLAPPLVTLLSSEAEVQYVALRNINLIVQKRPDILKNEMKVFFVKYNDPIYVKLEKLDIMIRLANQSNIAQVLDQTILLQLKYSLPGLLVDSHFVDKFSVSFGYTRMICIYLESQRNIG